MVRLQKIVNFIKPLSVTLICLILSFGIVGFFLVSIAFHNSEPLNTFNSFISIVLGVVALITSIVSMFLSFYSIEKSDESEKEQNELLTEIKNIQNNIADMVREIKTEQKEMRDTIKSSTYTEIDQIGDWKGVNNGKE